MILNQARFFGPKAKTASTTKTIKKETATKKKEAAPKVVKAPVTSKPVAPKPVSPKLSAGPYQIPVDVKIIHNIVNITMTLPSVGPKKFFVDKSETVENFAAMIAEEDPSVTYGKDIELVLNHPYQKMFE